ncbi:uncharacterized protein LOC128236967 [Mya arenaria]|uniref:uncharacterized protein LOC128236967 n=1 Tax=Mya arenaria TaxID=6604 RepID=UPI0022DF642A|nr:uncharacterized protein LOC128236967 [Mya arenaria]
MALNEDDVPPLEDMSELIQQVDALRELRQTQQGRKQSKTQPNGHAHVPVPANTTQTKSAKEKTHATLATSKTVQEKTESSSERNSVTQSSVQNPSSTSSKPSSSFGGMKKGFLFGAPSKSKSDTQKCDSSKKQDQSATKSVTSKGKTLEEIPFVKKNDEAQESNFRFSEVQEAMSKTTEKLLQNKEWVTDDLLKKLEKNEKLSKRLQDRKFVQAIGEFQRDPKTAMTKYGNNPEVQEFFQDFCGLMGDHFNKLGDKVPGGGTSGSSIPQKTSAPGPVQTRTQRGGADLAVHSSTDPHQPTAQDEAKMQDILADPEIRDILVDTKIQQLFETLRNNPGSAQRILQTADSDLRGKIQKLVQAGLLQFQT